MNCEHNWSYEYRGDERLCRKCNLWEQIDRDGKWRNAWDTSYFVESLWLGDDEEPLT